VVNPSAIVVDLTTPNVIVAACDRGSSRVRKSFSFPFAVAFRLENHNVSDLSGKTVSDIEEDDRTILFDHLNDDLQRIEDVDLQRRIIGSIWTRLCQEVSQGRSIDSAERRSVFFVTPNTYPASLLAEFRRVCRANGGYVIGSVINEALAFVLGFVSANHISPVLSKSSSTELILLGATSTNGAELAHITLRAGPLDGEPTIRINEFFRTSYRKLSKRLLEASFLANTDSVIVLESGKLVKQSQTAVDTVLGEISDKSLIRTVTDDVDNIKLTGGEYVAMRSLGGRTSQEQRFTIEAPTTIGVQITQNGICPILHKEDVPHDVIFPFVAKKAFRLRDNSQENVRLNLYSGLSSRVSESVLLAAVSVPIVRLARTSASLSDLAVRIVLESPNKGEYEVGLPFGNQILASGDFNVPPLIA
jgi:hypothetical protein